MSAIERDVRDYLAWMEIHNYATTTVAARRHYMQYFIDFADVHAVVEVDAVTLELLQEYQHQLFTHRKANGDPLSFGTQAQRLVPIAQFFSWLRRTGRVSINPAADLMMP